MARDLESILKDDDVVIPRQNSYKLMLATIKRQAEEIEALEYRVKTLLGGK